MSEAEGRSAAESPEPPTTSAAGRATGLEPPITGDAAVDEALSTLGTLDERPVGEHHDRLANVHEVLRSALDGRAGQHGGAGRDGSDLPAASD